MAARLRTTHQEDVRSKIKTSQLLNRLSDHALNGLELGPTQVRAIEVLLRKVLPDLQTVQHTGDADNPLKIVTIIELVAPERISLMDEPIAITSPLRLVEFDEDRDQGTD